MLLIKDSTDIPLFLASPLLHRETLRLLLLEHCRGSLLSPLKILLLELEEIEVVLIGNLLNLLLRIGFEEGLILQLALGIVHG
jgi:hypothetical protein